MPNQSIAPTFGYIKTKPWLANDFVVPKEVLSFTGMLSYQEKRMLYYLTLEWYSGQGAIADMGCFLGGSTICFAAALRQRGFTQPVIHSYDLFKLGEFERQKYFPDTPPNDLRTRAIFDENLRDYLDLINVHDGDVLDFPWSGGPIELLFIDIAKSYKVFDYILLHYFPSLTPMKSLLVMQDYLWGTGGPWHHVVMEKLSEYFSYQFDTEIASVVFRLEKDIPRHVLEQCLWITISPEEKIRLMDSAIEKLDTPQKKAYLMESKQLLVDGKDAFWGMHYHKL